MTPEQKSILQTLAEGEIRQRFLRIEEHTGKLGKSIKAFFCLFVDSIYAMDIGAVTAQDMANYDPEASILAAIWSGDCEIYDGSVTTAFPSQTLQESEPSALNREIDSLLNDVDDFERRETIRSDFEACIINALKACDEEGVFGDRTKNGITIFAFYVDDHDKNGEGSLLFRSAKALNDDNLYQQAIDFTGC